jgi:hypothetical protein
MSQKIYLVTSNWGTRFCGEKSGGELLTPFRIEYEVKVN